MSKIQVDTIVPNCGTNLNVGEVGDTVVVAGNIVKSNALQASDGGNIVNQSGTTITLGASGDSIALAAGATQSGFGRTGTVDWNTTPVTSTPTTGVTGIGYFINSSGGAKTINLPALPSVGDIMAVSDYAQSATTNNITIGRNGSNIQGGASDLVISKEGAALTLVYVDVTKGWIVTDSGSESDKTAEAKFITASGGTPTTSGDYKIHTFTGPGTFTVCSVGNILGSSTVDYLVVAAGASGGGRYGGGGGGGGYRESPGTVSGSYSVSPLAGGSALPVTATGYPITVGSGGSGVPNTPGSDDGSRGNVSTFSTITSAGGGAGAGQNAVSPIGTGGSGGGASYSQTGASGNTPPVSPPQGQNGGNGTPGGSPYSTGGGGGATEVGVNANSSPSAAGRGGAGATSCITSSPIARSGGGGGSGEGDHGVTFGAASPCGSGTAGGSGGSPSGNGAANRGGGSGGAFFSSPTSGASSSGNGGSGIVVIRYKFQ